jgi:hypothetical protein
MISSIAHGSLFGSGGQGSLAETGPELIKAAAPTIIIL